MSDPPEPEGEEQSGTGGADRTVRAALPLPVGGVRKYGPETGAIEKPHRPLALLTKERQVPLDFERRGAFIPGVTQELPTQTIEEQRGQVVADIAARVGELELLLENPDLEDATRGLIMAEINRLTEV